MNIRLLQQANDLRQKIAVLNSQIELVVTTDRPTVRADNAYSNQTAYCPRDIWQDAKEAWALRIQEQVDELERQFANLK